MIEEESSRQLFEKFKELRRAAEESTNEVLVYNNEPLDLLDINKDIDPLVTNPQLFAEIENDYKDVENDFSHDPALEPFKVRYEVV